MANRERGEVELVVNDKPYTLRLTTNAICELQERTKLTLVELINSLQSLDMVNMRALVGAALKPYHAKEFTDMAKVGAFMDDAGGIRGGVDSPVIRTLRELFALNQQPEERQNGSGGGNPPDAQDGTGDSSS